MAYEVLKINNQANAQQNAIELMQFIGRAFEGTDVYMCENTDAFFRAWSGNDQLTQVFVFINRSESGIIDEAILTHVAKNPLLLRPPMTYDFVKVNASSGLEEFRNVIIGALS